MRKHISFSELKIWNECAYKHKLIYLDNLKEFKGSEHTAFGTAVHYACEKAVLEDDSDLVEIFNSKFLEELTSLKNDEVPLKKELIDDMRSQGKSLLGHIVPSLKETFGDFEVVSVEEELYHPLQDELNFKGYIDLVLKTKEDGRYHVIDWKTCSWGWDSRRKSDRMTTYQLTYYKNFFAKKHGIELDNIDAYFALLKRTAKKNRVEIFKVATGNKKIDNSIKLLNKAVYNIKNKNFIKNKLSCTSGYGCEFYNTKFCTR